MAVNISGVTYYTTGEVIEALSISRQTFWRWRCDGKVPPGHRFRNRQLLFTESQFKRIEEFANRIEPESGPSPQLKLFGDNSGGGLRSDGG